jgi:pimeloyl-ACP methyl ester carboxylesterase
VRAIADALGIEKMAVWGYSGGGPHALACAALLPEIVSAVATLASVAPYGAEGLDWYAGMGEDNVEGFKLLMEDPQAARLKMAEERVQGLQATPETLAEGWASLVSAADAAVLSGELASFLVDSLKEGLSAGDAGWWDDGVAEMSPWGFDLGAIALPVQLWHGAEDRFVPVQHGRWLSERIPGVEAHLTEEDGHLTLLANRVPEVHDWLLRQG